jgi:3-oxoacyl-[acyl-carrier protein] reductase
MTGLEPTAIVTGGSRGIGRAIAVQLGREGWQVFLTYVSKPEKAENVCREIEASGGKARAFAVDVGDREAVSGFFKDAVKNQVHLGALVNNAGLTRDGLLLRMKANDWDDVLQTNLTGTFNCLQEASKIMIRQRQGRIVNISSVVASSGNPGQANYCASKAGIIGLTKASALELAPRNVTVNVVSPGFIETEMTSELDEETQKRYLERIPLGTFGKPEDVAHAVAWLASDRAAYITGQVIGVNGGMYL